MGVIPTPIIIGTTLVDGVDRNSYPKVSDAPVPYTCYVVGVQNAKSASPVTTPTLSGWGVTWLAVTGGSQANGGGTRRVTWFIGVTGAAPSSGQLTADYAGVTQIGCAICAAAVKMVPLTGGGVNAYNASNVFGAATNAATQLGISMGTYLKAANGIIGLWAVLATTTITIDASAGAAQIDQQGYTSPTVTILVQFNPGNDNNFSASFASNAAQAIAMELIAVNILKAAGVGYNSFSKIAGVEVTALKSVSKLAA